MKLIKDLELEVINFKFKKPINKDARFRRHYEAFR
jgi:hypothetical protein